MKLKELFENTIVSQLILKPKDVKNGMIKTDYSTSIISGLFSCHDLELTTLKNCPKEVNGDFNCGSNYITSLEYSPNIIKGEFFCYGNDNLTSLKGIGKDYCLEIDGIFYLTGVPLKSNILGLIKIKNLKHITMNNQDLEAIMNKHLKDRDITKCRQELIEAGLKEFAKL